MWVILETDRGNRKFAKENVEEIYKDRQGDFVVKTTSGTERQGRRVLFPDPPASWVVLKTHGSNRIFARENVEEIYKDRQGDFVVKATSGNERQGHDVVFLEAEAPTL